MICRKRTKQRKGSQSGYRFAVIENHEDDIEDVLDKLQQKIKRNINRQYIIEHDLEGYTLRGVDREAIAGRFESDPYSSQEPLVIVDGTPLNWNEFGRILTQFEGVQFKVSISDLTDA